MNKKYYVIANFKMNLTYNQTKEYLNNFSTIYKLENQNLYLGFALSPDITSLGQIYKNSNLKIGTQNISEFEKGSYTGECSILNCIDNSINFAIIGHYERKHYFQETLLKINKKISLCQKYNILPIVCVGESLEEFMSGRTIEALESQLLTIKRNLVEKNIILSYEPIYAIGNGKTPEYKHILKVVNFIKTFFNNSIPVLYGGSVNALNINELSKIKSLDGFLVGNASLEYKSFNNLINLIKK